MNTQVLAERTLQHLGIFYSTFCPLDEVVENGLNQAQRLLCLLRPDLVTLRTLVGQGIDAPVIDLRTHAPKAWRMLDASRG